MKRQEAIEEKYSILSLLELIIMNFMKLVKYKHLLVSLKINN